MNAVIYARYSCSSQTEQSIEGQLSECHAYAKRNDYTVVGEYIDRAISGRSDDRPDFLRMIADAKSLEFDYIIVYKLDRFARNRYDSAFYKHKLKQYGIKVLSATEAIGDNPESIILEAVLEASAEYFSYDLSQKVKRGMRASASKGKSTGAPAPLGYKHVGKGIEIDVEKAPIVKRIFHEYASGVPAVEIVNSLNNSGYTNARGKKFNLSSFNTLLKNQKYIGIWKYSDIIVNDVAPPLVDKETFEKVQQRLSLNKRAPRLSKKTDKVYYRLRGKLFCGYCGGSMNGESGHSKTGAKHYYYTCRNRKKLKNCSKKPEKKDFIEWYVAEQTALYILDKKNMHLIADHVAAQYKDEFNDSRVAELEKQVARLNREIDKCVDALIDSPKTARPRLHKKIDDLDAQINDLSIDLSKLRIAAKINFTKDDVLAFIQSFSGGDLMDDEYRAKIIDAFVNAVFLYDDRIIIYYNIKNSKQVSYIGMLEDIEPIEGVRPLNNMVYHKKQSYFHIELKIRFCFLYSFL